MILHLRILPCVENRFFHASGRRTGFVTRQVRKPVFVISQVGELVLSHVRPGNRFFHASGLWQLGKLWYNSSEGTFLLNQQRMEHFCYSSSGWNISVIAADGTSLLKRQRKEHFCYNSRWNISAKAAADGLFFCSGRNIFLQRKKLLCFNRKKNF